MWGLRIVIKLDRGLRGWAVELRRDPGVGCQNICGKSMALATAGSSVFQGLVCDMLITIMIIATIC